MVINLVETDPKMAVYIVAKEEFEAYENELLKKTGKEVLAEADQYSAKMDFLFYLEDKEISEEQARALLELDNILDACYEVFTKGFYLGYHDENVECVEKLANSLIEKKKKSE